MLDSLKRLGVLCLVVFAQVGMASDARPADCRLEMGPWSTVARAPDPQEALIDLETSAASTPVLLDVVAAASQLVTLTASLPPAEEAVPYSVQLEAGGGSAPYRWHVMPYIESTEAGTFAEVGVPQGWHSDWQTWGPVAIPFTFPFYGESYDHVRASAHGFLAFGSSVSTAWDGGESNLKSDVMIAPLWDGHDTSLAGGDIFIDQSASHFTVRWKGQNTWYGTPVGLSVTLYPNGVIRCSYDTGNESALIGISAGDSERYLVSEHAYTYPAQVDDILFTPCGPLPEGLVLSESGDLHGAPLWAGTRRFRVGVEDVYDSLASRELSLVVEANENLRPYFTSVTPAAPRTRVPAAVASPFTCVAVDPESALLSYTWTWDGSVIQEGSSNNVSVTPDWSDEGEHDLRVSLSEGTWVNLIWTNWTVLVDSDNDHDGLPNSYENGHTELDPWNPADGPADIDEDGLRAIDEFHAGTSITNADSDADSLPDGWEVRWGENPLDPQGPLVDLDILRVGEFMTPTGWYVEDIACLNSNRLVLVGGHWNSGSETGFCAVVDVDLDSPAGSTMAWCGLPRSGLNVAVTGDVAYVGTWGGAAVVDLSSVTPTVRTWLRADRSTPDVTTWPLVTANSWDRSISLYDAASDPLLPEMVETLSFSSGQTVHKIGMSGTTIAVGGAITVQGEDYSHIVHLVENSASGLVHRSSIVLGSTGGEFYSSREPDVELSPYGLFVYWHDGQNQDRISWFSTSDLNNPELLHEFGGEQWVSGISYSDGLLYVFGGSPQVTVWNVAGSVPIKVYSREWWTSATAFAVFGDYIYAYDYDGITLLHKEGFADTDGDGLRDRWELDRFGTLDTLPGDDPDSDEITNLGEHNAGLNPLVSDQDEDGVLDGDEARIYGTDFHNRWDDDSDGDRLSDLEEVTPGEDGYVTDPMARDTDGDKVDDSEEPPIGRDPTQYGLSYKTLLLDDAESGPAKWDVTEGWGISHATYSSGTSCFGSAPGGRVEPGQAVYLTLAEGLDLRAYSHVWVGFRHSSLDDRWPSSWIEVSRDSGQTWEYASSCYPQRNGAWESVQIGISRFCGSADTRIRFCLSVSQWSNPSVDGWLVDDIEIYANVCELSGSLMDASGNVLPWGRVELSGVNHPNGRVQSVQQVGNTGEYAFDLLVPGSYRLKADAPGYAAEYHSDAMRREDGVVVDLSYDQTRTIDFNLAMGQSPAYLSVTSAPPGQEVFIDFEPTGEVTPVILDDVAPGSHFVSLRPTAATAVEPQVVTVSECEVAEAGFDLSLPAYQVEVSSTPELGAEVFLDFQPTGMTTPCVLTNLLASVPYGSGWHRTSHHISIKKPGMVASPPQQVTMGESAASTGAVVSLSFSLPVLSVGMVEVTSSPRGARVFVDMQDTGLTAPVLLTDVAAGSHLIRGSMAGFRNSRLYGVRVEPGDPSRVHLNLALADVSDEDDDGLPDAWEEAEGLSGGTGDVYGASGDLDGDGMTNREELQAGTSPDDASDALRFLLAFSEGLGATSLIGAASYDPSLQANAAAGSYTLRWRSVPGKLYSVQYRDSLTAGEWLETGALIQATSTESIYTDEEALSTARFYRILVLPTE